MINGKDVLIYIGDELIAQATEVGIPVETPTTDIEIKGVGYWECESFTWSQMQNHDNLMGWQFYMRRGNKHYFRNGYFRIIVTAKELKSMSFSYGEIVNINFEF